MPILRLFGSGIGMSHRWRDALVACLPSASRSLAIAIVMVALGTGALEAADCMDRFPEGRFGIAPSHPAVARLALQGFRLLYLVRQPITISPEDCEYVHTGDVFRMVDTPAAGALLAGCLGDFDGDGRIDVALLGKRQRDGVIVPLVFRFRGGRYEATEIEGITDPYGFARDRSIWPGPFCAPRPPRGAFTSSVEGGTVNVVGDLFTIGWKTYFWNPAAGRFDGILTSD